ncbi:uncharacterized protein [Physcomitrium patens]|uniref:H/ACA ribonucleoprotein complex non-core subunit NAF1 n=1 Tax=Physcomitrium patens TaxID=3218 RepID=A0A2K1JYG8_PHYPA|nr:H/ACA ribonucleoprotein complex non-core subunit NAF1-like isoform X2 [Physcomitrium patens]PNR46569.1 hypothetical protein PHYPA_013688 [Physcomitrium patens]|eukprot:XP_024386538.1 H/ACA ribonucleoprotein complex non-core subunit NAF1-like isoform X2 [Physcomitrella patens]
MMAGEGKGGSEMEVEAGEIVMETYDIEMLGSNGGGRMSDTGSRGDVGITSRKALEERTGCSKEEEGESNMQISQQVLLTGDIDGCIPQDVLLAAEAAEAFSQTPVHGNGHGVAKGCEEENESEDEEGAGKNGKGMVEEDSDPLVDSGESSDASSDEEDDVNAADMQKRFIENSEHLEKMVRRANEADSDEEDDSSEPPRTANEVTDLPPVSEIDAVLEPNQVPREVGVVSSIMDKQVIVEAVEHEMVLNEGSILWLSEQRKPLGIVDEVFGPVKKPYYVIRYNKAADVPDKASRGVTVGFVQEFANFVLKDDTELRKKGYDASGQHDEELSDDEEFSDDEKEEEAKRMKKQAAKQGHQAGVGGDAGWGGGRGGGNRHKPGGGRNSRGRGGGRGRFSRSDSASMIEVDDAIKARAAGRGHQRSNSLGSPVFSRDFTRDKGPGGEHHRGQFHPSPDRQNSWNRSPRSDMNYSQVPDLRSSMINYNERQPLPYQSPHHDFISGVRPIQQQPPQISPQRSGGPPHWGPSSGPLHGEVPQVHQVQSAPYLGSNVRWSHQAAGDYQHPEGMYQARVNMVPIASYPLPQQMGMYAPPHQPVGTGVFIPPAQYTRNSQVNQMQQTQMQLGQGQMQQSQGQGQVQGSVHPGSDGRGPVGQWPVNGPSIVTGIPCYSNPPQPVYMQPGAIRPGMMTPGPNSNVYWSNNPGR